MSMVVELQGVTKRFGGLTAVDDCSLALPAGTISGLVGPNGSGKSTLFNMIAGVIRPDRGRIVFDGRRIDGRKPHQIVRMGLGRTFQTTRLFPSLTVYQNVLLGAQGAVGEPEKVRRAEQAMATFGIPHLAEVQAEALSFGQQRLVELARTMVGNPKLVILDEPFAGLAPLMVEQIVHHLREMHAGGVTLFLIEHNLEVVLSLCTHLFVLDFGRLIAEGPPETVRNSQAVIDAYLGMEDDADVA